VKKKIGFPVDIFLSLFQVGVAMHPSPSAPVGINQLVRALPKPRSDEAERLLADHSLYTSYESLLTREQARALKTRFLIGRHTLGDNLLHWEPHEVKFCPSCVLADKIPFLRRKHQLIGYQACLDHKIRLVTIPVPRKATRFFIDLEAAIEQARTSPRPCTEIELDLAKRLDAFPATSHGEFSAQALEALAQKYASLHGKRRNTKRFDDFYRSLSVERKIFKLSEHWSLKTSAGRAGIRLFRTVALLHYCENTTPSPLQGHRHFDPLAPPPEEIKLVPPSRPRGRFSCRNPTCTLYGKKRAVITGQGLNFRNWVFNCQTCGYTYESRVVKGKQIGVAFVSAGPSLEKFVASLWPTHEWDPMRRLTGLTDPQLVMIGQHLGLPFEGRPKRILRALAYPHRVPKQNGTAERCKQKLLSFFAINPSYDELKNDKHLYFCYSNLRYWDAPWILANISPNLRPYLKNNPRHKRKPTMNVHEGNSERPSDG
jgi:hypothetical protein